MAPPLLPEHMACGAPNGLRVTLFLVIRMFVLTIRVSKWLSLVFAA